MEEPIIVEGSVVHHRPDAYRTPPTRGLEPPLGLGPASLSVPPVTPAALPPGPGFDAYLAVVKTLLGGLQEDGINFDDLKVAELLGYITRLSEIHENARHSLEEGNGKLA